MNSQCPPCSSLEEAARSNPCSPLASAAPEQNSRADPCPCRAVCPSCPCDIPRDPLGVTSPSVPAGSGALLEADPAQIPSSAEEPFTVETPGMCAMRFPLQKSIVAVELCPPDSFPPPRQELRATKTAGTCLENLGKLCRELPVAALEPCTLEVLELGAEEPGREIPGDPSASRSGISTGPCASQGLGDAEDGSQTCPGSPFRLDSRTSSMVERCLSRCQSWFRGKK